MNFESDRNRARAFQAQTQTLTYLRGELNREDIPFDGVHRLSDRDGVRVVTPLEHWDGDRIGRRVMKVAYAYAAAAHRTAWTPSGCTIEVPIRQSNRVATGRVEHEWLPDGPPEDATDEAVEEMIDRIRQTIETDADEVDHDGR